MPPRDIVKDSQQHMAEMLVQLKVKFKWDKILMILKLAVDMAGNEQTNAFLVCK